MENSTISFASYRRSLGKKEDPHEADADLFGEKDLHDDDADAAASHAVAASNAFFIRNSPSSLREQALSTPRQQFFHKKERLHQIAEVTGCAWDFLPTGGLNSVFVAPVRKPELRKQSLAGPGDGKSEGYEKYVTKAIELFKKKWDPRFDAQQDETEFAYTKSRLNL